MYIESLNQKLKKAREKTGFTQREVAKETGIPQPTIARFESGNRIPDVEKLGILADFYGVSVDWLLGTAGNQKS
jgi:transcriptional regulator with XRE-family HTH domain